jgi:hypothetical protein
MTTGTEAQTMVRVWNTEVWDVVEVEVKPGSTFGDVKVACLAEALGRSVDPADYDLKYRGGLVLDETQTLAARDVPDGAPMVVSPARRRPVR